MGLPLLCLMLIIVSFVLFYQKEVEMEEYRIHGDNIVECERLFRLFVDAYDGQINHQNGPNGSATVPEYSVVLKDGRSLNFTFFPGFGRWDQDILSHIRCLGGVLREAADVILTKVNGGSEKILLAIEFCSALPAGNQAWQRSGRAYSFAKADIPFLYVAELGGYELDSKRRRKATRLPNPAVPFSYLSYNKLQNEATLPIYTRNPGADEETDKKYGTVYGEKDLLGLISCIFNGESISEIEMQISQKASAFVVEMAEGKRDTLSQQEWGKITDYVMEGNTDITEFIVRELPTEWSKTAYIDDLTDTAKALMKIAAKYAVGITSSKLPMSIIPRTLRKSFVSELLELYGEFPNDYVNWLNKDQDLVTCWVMGFKPRGDDARPDRGLPPLTRMLVGDSSDLLTIVYGPARAATWPMLHNEPDRLILQNGLWESILGLSDAVLIDSATDKAVTQKGYLREHWGSGLVVGGCDSVLVKKAPETVGENDVDTVIHNLFSYYTDGQVFEGMCNPPGGDWSGISILNDAQDKEYRWLSLPRVSSDGAKRPDHVFQIFNIHDRPVCLVIESKELPRSVEDEIGPRLVGYLSWLFSFPSCVERSRPEGSWTHRTSTYNNNLLYVSCAAFLDIGNADLRQILQKSECDLCLAVGFDNDSKIASIRIQHANDYGYLVREFLEKKLTLASSEYRLEN